MIMRAEEHMFVCMDWLQLVPFGNLYGFQMESLKKAWQLASRNNFFFQDNFLS